MQKKHPIAKILGAFIKNIDDNPKVQLRIHTYGFYYWTINFPAIIYLYFFQQKLWLSYGLFITLIYSIYANWTSDYTGMSSAQSVANTGGNSDVKAIPFPGAGVVVEPTNNKGA